MRSFYALALGLAGLGVASGAGIDVEYGQFDANYMGGDAYYYQDANATLAPLPFVTTHHMTCKATRSRRFEPPFHGVSLGGFLVIEPWITPSLFYQFLGTPERYGADAPRHTAVDLYSFCAVLGAEEANKQLRRHWAAWVTEDDIRRLSEMKVNALRIPVGDWMWAPYGPYAGCTEGALDELDRALGLAHKYGMRVLLDLHGVRGSQNGFDNSGRTSELQWTQMPGMPPAGAVQSSFSHWPVQSPGWIGQFDRASWRTVSINYTQIDRTIATLVTIADTYGSHPAVFGLQPLNEPWQFTPIGPLKRFYWEAYKAVMRRAPHWKFVLSDSFRPQVELWAPFMTGCPNVILSTHLHQAWMAAQPVANFLINACDSKHALAGLHEDAMDVIVGEWSLATDNCAMWINGFNDNLPGYPTVECHYVPCAPPYMGAQQPGAPPDSAKGQQGPFGTGMSTPRDGLCPIDRPWPDDDSVTRRLAHKKLSAFIRISGHFFWNFKTELEPKWSYLEAVERGWIPRDTTRWSAEIENACFLEDRSGYTCTVKPDATDELVARAVAYACQQPGMEVPYCFQDEAYRTEHASKILTQHWRANHRLGATCDFDGIAELMPDPTFGSDPSDTATDADADADATGSEPTLPRLAAAARAAAGGALNAALALGVLVVGALAARTARRGARSSLRASGGARDSALTESLVGARDATETAARAGAL